MAGMGAKSNFLSKLHKWNIAHKDNKLPTVLVKVNSILESKSLEAALEFIPDNPFPAKSLIEAMINLFHLRSVSDVSSQTPCHLHIISHPPRNFLRRNRIYNFSKQVARGCTKKKKNTRGRIFF